MSLKDDFRVEFLVFLSLSLSYEKSGRDMTGLNTFSAARSVKG